MVHVDHVPHLHHSAIDQAIYRCACVFNHHTGGRDVVEFALMGAAKSHACDDLIALCNLIFNDQSMVWKGP